MLCSLRSVQSTRSRVDVSTSACGTARCCAVVTRVHWALLVAPRVLGSIANTCGARRADRPRRRDIPLAASPRDAAPAARCSAGRECEENHGAAPCGHRAAQRHGARRRGTWGRTRERCGGALLSSLGTLAPSCRSPTWVRTLGMRFRTAPTESAALGSGGRTVVGLADRHLDGPARLQKAVHRDPIADILRLMSSHRDVSSGDSSRRSASSARRTLGRMSSTSFARQSTQTAITFV